MESGPTLAMWDSDTLKVNEKAITRFRQSSWEISGKCGCALAFTGGCSPMVETSDDKLDYHDIGRRLKFEYAYAPKDIGDKYIESIQNLIKSALRPTTTVDDLLKDVARIVYQQFRIREITIGLLDPNDGRYKYRAMMGLKESTWDAHRGLSYTRDDFFDASKYTGTVISDYSKLLLAEDEPYLNGEEKTFDRNTFVKSKRKSLMDSIEGDYLDITINGPSGNLIGWIEISGTWTGKLPDVSTIRWMELLACILGSLLTLKGVGVAKTPRAAPGGKK
jgi:hypothetical protein